MEKTCTLLCTLFLPLFAAYTEEEVVNRVAALCEKHTSQLAYDDYLMIAKTVNEID